ncbi:unnamed protein product [Arctogadus glacialis]
MEYQEEMNEAGNVLLAKSVGWFHRSRRIDRRMYRPKQTEEARCVRTVLQRLVDILLPVGQASGDFVTHTHTPTRGCGPSRLRLWTLPPGAVDPPTCGCGPSHLRLWTLPPAAVDPPTWGCGPSHPQLWTRPPAAVDPPTCGCGPAHLRLWTLPPGAVDPPTCGCGPAHLLLWTLPLAGTR